MTHSGCSNEAHDKGQINADPSIVALSEHTYVVLVANNVFIRTRSNSDRQEVLPHVSGIGLSSSTDGLFLNES